MLGIVLAGVTNDLVFRNYQFLLAVSWNLIEIVWNIWDIVYPYGNTDYIQWTLAFFGVASGFSDMFIMILLPMTVADKNRIFAYELTMIGTILALVYLTTYFMTSLCASFTSYIIKFDLNLGNIFNRCVIIVVLMLSSWVFYNKAKI